MMIENIAKVSKEFLECQDLKTWLKLFSVLTWNKIGFTRTRNRLKIYETTITQDLLFQFRLFAEATPLPIELFEAKSEKTNGNDFEFLIEVHENQYLMLPCQAKIIYKNGKYMAIDHNVSNFQQIQLLTKYAKNHGGIPIYLFYNYYDNYKEIEKIREKINYDIEELGCSIVDALYLKDKFFKFEGIDLKINTLPNFKNIHPNPAIPFHQIIDLVDNFENINSFFEHSSKNNKKVFLYSREDLLKDDDWKDLVPMPYIGRTEPEKQINYSVLDRENYVPEFAPKFRFIISKEKQERKISISTIG